MPNMLHDERRIPIFIHSEIDDMNELSPNAMRVYMHLARRAGTDNRAWPSYQSIGDHCFSSVYTSVDTRKKHAIAAIKELIASGLIRKEERKDSSKQLTNLYVLCDVHVTGGGVCTSTPPVSVQAPKGTPKEEYIGIAAQRNDEKDHLHSGVESTLPVQESLLPMEKEKSPPLKEKVQPKDHPAVQAYRTFVERYPTKAQMKLIVEKDPDINRWTEAMRTWIGRGYNPQNVIEMLKWAENPHLMERRPTSKLSRPDPYGGEIDIDAWIAASEAQFDDYKKNGDGNA